MTFKLAKRKKCRYAIANLCMFKKKKISKGK